MNLPNLQLIASDEFQKAWNDIFETQDVYAQAEPHTASVKSSSRCFRKHCSLTVYYGWSFLEY